jgi:hypothetical protein
MRTRWIRGAQPAGAILASLLAGPQLAGCYQPTLQEGAPCGPGATCPTGQECRAGTCFFTTTPGDAAASDALEIDTIPTDALPDGPPYVPWAAPAELTSLEIPESGEDDPSVTADKLTVVMTADTTVAPINSDIFIGTRTALTDTFTVTALTAVNSTSDENSPEISGDGNTLYFTSNVSGLEEVYISTKTSNVWSAPALVTELSPGTNGDVAISPDGLTAAVMRGSTLYIHTRAATTAPWGAGVAHGELNVANDVAAPTITNGAQTIYVHDGAPRDLYVSHRNPNGTFQTPQPVSELNTATGREAAPFVLEGDDYMIFENGYDIYETTR